MSTIKAVIKKKAYANGEYPVFIYYNAKHLPFPQHKSIGITVAKEHFNKGKGNEYISKKLTGLATTYNNFINEVLTKIKKADVEIRETIKHPELEDLFKFAGLIEEETIKFFDFAEKYIATKKVSTRRTYSQYFVRIKPILGENFRFKDFNEKTIHSLQKALQLLDMENSSINLYTNLIRRICIDASKTPNPNNPKEPVFDFKEHYFSNLKAKSESKVSLSVDEIIKIVNCEIPKNKPLLEISRDVFIFQFFSQGNRISDVLRLLKDEVKENTIKIVELKTSKGKSSPLTDVLKKIINKYWHQDSIYVFPVLTIDKRLTTNNEKLEIESNIELRKHVSMITRRISDVAKLAGVRSDISSHVARHSFASIADKKLGGDLRILQAIMNHHSRNTTENYVHSLRDSNYKEETLKVYEDFNFSEN